MPGIDPQIISEIDKLLAAGFIEEVSYAEWLTNVVLVVKKDKGLWRVCVDYTDLDKACPKDNFPLPRIDQLIDSTSGNQLLSFTDAYSDYNQIMMHEDDKANTSFIIERGSIMEVYVELKKVEATYQSYGGLRRRHASQLSRASIPHQEPCRGVQLTLKIQHEVEPEQMHIWSLVRLISWILSHRKRN
ncbi:hypothetical protein L3X38_003560 [Prunus dulcis]|uniref:Reverse transcriptase domain-containing protein n=1 Tax=Prunus dulcis TaxID=3755 RepID=A0AAD4ZM82_PRUDU|nr:hypothetical protein L3X38_003560 [Prunus dulcis]